MARLPTIPDFTTDANSMNAGLRAVKLAIEILGGMRQGESFGAPLTFVQGSRPQQDHEGSLRTGDRWIDTTTDYEYYWSAAGDWRRIL